ncbi:MAG: glutamate-5-semialdehyde dehydrogenase [Gemmataceae bacterium]
MSDFLPLCRSLADRARLGATFLAGTYTAVKNAWLLTLADSLLHQQAAILEANARDLALAPQYKLSPAELDRLRLTPQRLAQAAEGLRQVAALPDPVGELREGSVRPNGLEVRKIGVPLGVILFLYESRPNVTLDAAALCVKSGNAVILRGGKEALHSNMALYSLIAQTLQSSGLPTDVVQFVDRPEREIVGQLLQMNDRIDLVIPRGGESLIRRVTAEATMPVMKHSKGLCHVYVHKAADRAMAQRVVLNAKCQRPGVCNAAECLLVDAAIAEAFLPEIATALLTRGVELRGCPITCRLVPQAKPATTDDYHTEYLDFILSVRVVADLDQALEHIRRHGSGHTEAILTSDLAVARRFTQEVDSAAVLVNASTRFHDGYELGLGAEIGISTDRLHARGPCGLRELTTYKYVVYGEGQIRGE